MRAEEVRLVYGSPIVLLLNLVNAAVAVSLLWTLFPAEALLLWLALFMAVVPARLWLWRRFRQAKPGPEAMGRWALAATLGAAATGMLWGALGTVFFVTTEPIYYVFVVFVLGGMTAGSALKDSAYLPSFYAFMAPAVGPTVLALMARGGFMFDEMGLMIVVFTIVLILVGRGNNRWIQDSIRLRIDQTVLNADLQRATAQMAENLEALRRHQRDMSSIAKLSDFLQACQRRDEAYPIIETAAARLFPGLSGALALLSPDTQDLETVSRWGKDPTVSDSFHVDDCWALRTGQVYEVASAETPAQCRHFPDPPEGGYLCLPLNVQGETIGLLHLSVPPDREIDEDTHRLMATFGDVIKLSLSNLKLRESLSEQALRDPLTGVFNRRYLAETLPREIRRARRDRTDLTVAMIDVDHFKAFNDTYGHGAGDLVLKEVGAFLNRSLRAGDIACRYGGEEFLLVLAECDADEAHARLAQLCTDIKLKAFAFRKQLLPNITVSVGIAQMEDGLTAAEPLITAADQALYKAKADGRDRIEIFKPGKSAAA
ncbi:hypothetical protein DJ017_16780 [Phenylobacterium soli]|uniref:diguanylate cyclase n=1 Tax=Phenylobacterium soli TaxID=2170551 RepID=A0A328ANV7_9CAUL|nr:hypothetical protein DJ017_16780 [Phenylobacterium soli]